MGERESGRMDRMMTRKDRIIACCEHEPADRVPVYHASVSSRSASIVGIRRPAGEGMADKHFPHEQVLLPVFARNA